MLSAISNFSKSTLVRTVAGLVAAILCAPGAAAFGAGVLVAEGRNDQALRIQDHLVSVEIDDRVALTRVHQTFENTTDRQLEGTYIFPIPEGADLTDFQMSFNGKMVKGEVLEANEAREIYESIVRRQKDPGLIEFIGRRLLKARVFPIEPKSTTTIELSYQQVTDTVSDMWRYQYPLRTPGHNSIAHGTVRFDVTLNSRSPLRGLWSPTHDVEVFRKGDHQAKVGFERNATSLDEDFVLLFDAEDRDIGLSVVGYREDESQSGHFLLLLSPKDLWDQGASIAQDYLFVADTSGSMAGEGKLDQVKEALTYCINRLEPRDRFSVVRFSTGFDVLFDELAYATGDAKKQAADRIGQFKATGGTNIKDALEAALALRPDADAHDAQRPFVVVFLTDGQGDQPRETVERALHEQIGDRLDSLRMFPFGVGHDVNTIMLDGLANRYGGMPTYVQPGERLEHSLGDFFAVFSEPVLTDLKLDLPNAQISDQYPPKVGDLYHGRQILLAGRFDENITGPVRLTARRGDKTLEYTWDDVSFAGDPSADYVPKLWAGRKIAYLLDRIRVDGESSEMINEILELSIAHGIQTPYSSWLVAPEGRPGGLARQRGGGGGIRDLTLDHFFAPSESFGMEGGAPALYRVEELARESTFGDTLSPASRAGENADDQLDDEAVSQSTGKSSVQLATRLAIAREAQSLESGSRNQRRSNVRRIGDRAYYGIGSFLVDGAFSKDTDILEVRFASDAYFELLTLRPEWKAVFAQRGGAVVMVNDTKAILIHSTDGIEELTDEQRTLIKTGFTKANAEEAESTDG